MRIISQDGLLDIDYENNNLWISSKITNLSEVAFSNGDTKEEYVYVIETYEHTSIKLGEYSTEEKALKVMEMIRKQYNALQYGKALNHIPTYDYSDLFYFRMPQDEVN